MRRRDLPQFKVTEAPDVPRKLRLWTHQWIGLPALFAIPVLALIGIFGGDKGETVLRVGAIYVFVFAMMRLLGKRELGQLSPFELVMLMLIPDISQLGMMRDDHSMTNAFVGLGTLFTLCFLQGLVSYLSKRTESVMESRPVVLFHKGKFIEDALHVERVSTSEIIASMHRSGIEELKQVKWVILEPDGDITFIPLEPRAHAPASTDRDSAVGAA